MKALFLFLIISCSILFTACNEEGNSSEGAAENESNEVVEGEESENELEASESEAGVTFPLTGEPAEGSVDHRAFGVMIENSSASRPHSGLYQADVVYEVLSEGQITRLLAFFHSKEPDRIGNVRSARDYYIHLNNGYDAIYASAGGSPGAFELIESGQVAFISGLNYDGRYFTRSSDRPAPHNMYTTYDDLVSAANDRGLDMEGRKPPELPFSSEGDIQDSDGTANGLDISYNSSTNDVRFDYDEELNGYIRSVGGERVDDVDTGEPVAPQNILIVEASHQVMDDQGRRSVDIESGGQAYLVQGGHYIEAEWQNIDGVILPFKNGEALSFQPGQTWISFVESGIEGRISFDE